MTSPDVDGPVAGSASRGYGAATLLALFLVGAARAMLTRERWWRAGLETLSLGALVAAAAYGASAVVAAALN